MSSYSRVDATIAVLGERPALLSHKFACRFNPVTHSVRKPASISLNFKVREYGLIKSF